VRIALVARELYPYIGGGIAPIVTAAARLLSQAAEVTVVTSGEHRDEHERLRAAGDPRLVPESVRMAWVEEPREDELGAYYSYMHHWSARVHATLRDVYGDDGPDLIEFCDYLGEGFVTVQAKHTLADWLQRTLVCVRIHTTAEICSILDGHLPEDFAAQAVFEAERYVLRHADRVLWSGGDVLGTYQRLYGAEALAPAARIPDAFLVERVPPDGPGERPGAGPLRLLYSGRLERRKGVQNLIRAATALDRADWHLTVLGGDTMTAPLESSMRDQLKLMAADDPRIEFLDRVPRHEVDRFLRQAHVVVVPSLWECWPNVAREALMYNRPLLATPVGGLCEMAQPGRSGWHAEDTSAEALHTALDSLLDSPDGVDELIVTERPRAVWRELTDPDAFVRRYQELVSSPPARPLPRSTEPLVSIVIPYFELEEHVEETVDSALAQTYRRIEVIVVNDGSLRERDAFLFDLERLDRVSVVTQANAGLGAARNFGIANSVGRYVLPLDSDDVILPTFVERCVDLLERQQDLAYATTWVEYMKTDGTPMVDENSGYMPFGNWSELIRRNNIGGTCTALMRRRLFDLGFRYSHDLTSYEDWFLYLELREAGHLGAVIPERLFRYRVREDSMMREIGDPLLKRLYGEMLAHERERSHRWTGEVSTQGVLTVDGTALQMASELAS
jgi:glycosyltransferase involved in cell wall biosynthesis